MEQNLPLKFMTRSELAKSIGVSRWTLHRRLNEKGINLPKGLLSPEIIRMVVQILNPLPSNEGKGESFDEMAKKAE